MSTSQVFPIVRSSVDLRSDQYLSNRDGWTSLLSEFEKNSRWCSGEALLLDPDSPFLELCPFAGFDIEDSSPGASLVTGIGSVNGSPCMVLAHIPTLSGGAWNEYTVLKQNRITEVANENDLPIVALVQSAGVFLPQQFRVFHKGGQIFRDLALRTHNQKPSCAVVFGSSTAGGAYHPALSDYTIFVEGQAQVFLGGPPLVKMATGEVVEAEQLGGARVHGGVTGLADQVAADEFDAIRKARDWVATLNKRSMKPRTMTPPLAPRYAIDDLLALVNPDIRKPFDMKEVVLRIVDDSRLSIFKPQYGSNLLTTWASIMGIPVGIMANQTPIINGPEADKGAQFIRMCNQQNVPIVFLHNVTGFMVGTKAEHSGIIKRGAQLVSAVSCSTVPHISIILGASYGAGNYAMCGRSYKPRFLFTWPTGRCSVMGADQLSGVMEQVEANSAKSKGVVLDAEEVKQRVSSFRDRVNRDSSCYRTSGVVLDDGVIDPRDTRDVLGLCLEVVCIPDVQGSIGHRALARIYGVELDLMDGERAPKRARQACLNCRRKKTRCSGETPICSFCARLKQPCVWEHERDYDTLRRGSFFNTPDSALAARVALLESKLNQLGSGVSSDSREAALDRDSHGDTLRRARAASAFNDVPAQSSSSAFLTLPTKPVMLRLIDKYFTHCHNQPYAFFHEATFRARFEEDALPDSLLYAFAATACRFMDEPPYQNQVSIAIASYSAVAWPHIFQQSFSYENDLDVTVVQALSMLAVIDFTAGHPRHGWVKVALVVRFAQALRLNEEPSGELPEGEREERRRTFWSIYLLDRLVSVGPNRPPSFIDDDCSVHLPCSDEAFFAMADGYDAPTIQEIADDVKGHLYQSLDYFALTVLMACTLGDLIRYCLKRTSTDRHAPWDSRSAYCHINTMLLQYESHSLLTYSSLSNVLQNRCTMESFNQHSKPGHLVFSQALFHVNHCLLNHPFILYNLFQRCTAPVPLSFAREALARSHGHAAQLLELIHDAQQLGGLADSSFIGYCAVLAGILFRLYEHHQDDSTATFAKHRVTAALEYLERQPLRWAFHASMAVVVRKFSPSQDVARSFIDPIKLAQKTTFADFDRLWPLIDYASLQNTTNGLVQDTKAPTVVGQRCDTFSTPSTHADNNTTLSVATLASPVDSSWMHPDALHSYLGDDMGGLWSEVLNG